jgi:CHASE2 domain-containing sensor protein|tara:strand:+ start:88 stop:390 length:303 start_codon:yes stop_codon:yes gene_type:complete
MQPIRPIFSESLTYSSASRFLRSAGRIAVIALVFAGAMYVAGTVLAMAFALVPLAFILPALCYWVLSSAGWFKVRLLPREKSVQLIWFDGAWTKTYQILK